MRSASSGKTRLILAVAALVLVLVSLLLNQTGAYHDGLLALALALIATYTALQWMISPIQATPRGWYLDINLLPDAVIVTDGDDRVVARNQTATKLVDSIKVGDLITERFGEWHQNLVNRDDADAVLHAVLTGGMQKFGDKLVFENGQVVERFTNLFDEGEERLWILRDVTHTEMAESDSVMHQSMVEADAARTAEMAEQLYMAKAELEKKQKELTRLANTDPLTGLYNRRRFMVLGEGVVQSAQREIWVLMLDIDNFKSINDTHGHGAGDQAIRDVAALLEDHVTGPGFAGRMGGEEFALTLPDMDRDSTLTLAETLRQAVADRTTRCETAEIRFTTSIGMACVKPGEQTLEAALDRADQALYEAKHGGRNRVVIRTEKQPGTAAQGPA
ncbi:GGDEF domain-containing protein [Yunchengibacter salinarum]|uniref:GGDEF domain-containing protein n=1 Tax=Yunchengibacter salinarum TaxID=3133399 RepID=UPI0035B5CFB8